jgi:microcystin-dependent protein
MTAEKIVDITSDAVVGAVIDQATGVLTLQTQGGETISVGSVDPNPVDQNQMRLNAVSAAYPVGSIFMSTVATNPATQLGVGTWAEWGKGRVPVGVDTAQTEFDAVEETGGSKTHTLTESQIPAHSHGVGSLSMGFGGSHTHQLSMSTSTGNNPVVARGGSETHVTSTPVAGDGSHVHVLTGTVAATGGGQPHNILQPYITCYMWKRTA